MLFTPSSAKLRSSSPRVSIMFLRPEVPDADRLVQIARSYESAPRWDNWSYPALQEIRASTEGRVFEGVAGYTNGQFVIGRGSEAESVIGLYVTGNWFDMLGIRPALGRLFLPEEDATPGTNPVVETI